ncbi:MAG: radical SAM protein [Planctomycetes bacterium]|nr:radical SAM protein [Planctomycetota bacterium]
MGSHTKTLRHGRAGGASWLPSPRLVQWMATLDCPLSCPHCLAGESGLAREMPLRQVFALIDQCAELEVEEFLVTGGEPLVRPDLPEVIRRLGVRGIRWSVNTAVMPPGSVRDAIREYPPVFAAVSLDGPEEVHDSFRGRAGAFDEALEAIRYFKSLAGVQVAAGTTVTTANFDALEETLPIAAGSGADEWGIHLPVKEGRAAERPDLFIDRKQMKRLLKFVAEGRKRFPVTMADEMGHCGAWERLVRSAPFYCGAGRTHCVVLPDGSVVPCTTMDVTTSAGNIKDRPLAEIWRDGFGEIRSWEPEGKCGTCEYAPACRGGCWLQRRHGTECFRDVWAAPAMLKAAAAAVMAGTLTLSAAGQEAGVEPGPAVPTRQQPAEAQVPAETRLEMQIYKWYTRDMEEEAARFTAEKYPSLDGEMLADPAGQYLKAVIDGKLPEGIEARCAAVQKALETRLPSVPLASLLWRGVGEACMNGKAPAERTEAERRAVMETMARLYTAATAWHAQHMGRRHEGVASLGGPVSPVYGMHANAMVCKGHRPVPSWARFAVGTEGERIVSMGPPAKMSVREWTAANPLAAVYAVNLAVSGGSVTRVSPAGRNATGRTVEFGVFDVLQVAEGGAHISVTWRAPHREKGMTWTAEVPGSCDITYPELMMLARPERQVLPLFSVRHEGPCMIRYAAESVGRFESLMDPPPADLAEQMQLKRQLQAVKKWVADFWMF